MHIYHAGREDMAQYTVRLSMGTNAVFEEIAKEGQWGSVNKLLESILLEVALDELWQKRQSRGGFPKIVAVKT